MTHRSEYSYGSGSGTGTGTGTGPPSSSSGSGFGTFLEAIQSDLEFHTEDAESRVIKALSDGGSGDVSLLMQSSGCLPLAVLLEAIDRLERFRLLEHTSGEDGEVYRLTGSGRRASQMMGLWTGKQ